MDIDEVLKLENQVCFAVYACSREITKLYRPILEEFGLTYTQYVTMLVLWEQDGITVKELGRRLHLDSGTLTPLLKKLESAGLVTRTRDKADERNVVITLTEKGHRMKKDAATVPGRLFNETVVDEAEVKALRDLITRMLARISPQETE
ncbi:MarR family winged helix-turn-helix transcriptional regulator [Paenibacillus tarimensis]|uniref:MarR family winged helix-turn-helix transcriptional regulator n=1 Tax=Paenibacillus tarimensis TaxID=416012 RepID=UPI001F436B72|nr:MarR family transcriptional regulator [Paenibacillus tarimensis]MCF2942903.1 MarR family transcriptional regulator [Paenibacillus tarimensis]